MWLRMSCKYILLRIASRYSINKFTSCFIELKTNSDAVFVVKQAAWLDDASLIRRDHLLGGIGAGVEPNDAVRIVAGHVELARRPDAGDGRFRFRAKSFGKRPDQSFGRYCVSAVCPDGAGCPGDEVCSTSVGGSGARPLWRRSIQV
mgnify:CR=1 FL=1